MTADSRNGAAPGPWSVYDGHLHDNVFRRGRTVCAGEDANRHAVAYCDYMWPGRAEANARLIAAAPELLAALHAALNWYTPPNDSGPFPIKQIADAIAKAEGRL